MKMNTAGRCSGMIRITGNLQKGQIAMAKNLVIVESPAKAKTIKKFLGSNYEVIASNGHVRDLPKSQMGIDVDNDFEPKYITIRGKGDILAALDVLGQHPLQIDIGRRPTRSISQLTRTVRERLYPII